MSPRRFSPRTRDARRSIRASGPSSSTASTRSSSSGRSRRELMRGILAKELAPCSSGAGLRHREWAVEWEASALEFLLDKGFSPTMGARPLKRAIDQHLLAPLAAHARRASLSGRRSVPVRPQRRPRHAGRVRRSRRARRAAPAPEAEPAMAAGLYGRQDDVAGGGRPREERTSLVAELDAIDARLADARWSSHREWPGRRDAAARLLVAARTIRRAVALCVDRSRQGGGGDRTRPRSAAHALGGRRGAILAGSRVPAGVRSST